MKVLICFLFLSASVVAAEWIEPPARSAKGYLVPTPDYNPIFPKDHGAHREYGLEWWYWVGHLESNEGEESYGFQSTVFRLAGDPNYASGLGKHAFGNRQLFLAHAALSDLANKNYIHHERVVREGWQARAGQDTLDLKVAGIQASMHENGQKHRLTTLFPDGAKLELELTPEKPLIRFGERGLSRKGDGASSVSWYWSYTRLKAEGMLTRKGASQRVSGEAWMDHEISSSQLGKGLEGWDWTCMQLNDGTEVKAYRLRKEDGTSDRWSSVYWIDGDGEVEQVYAEKFSWNEVDRWKSSTTGLTYPTDVRIEAEHPQLGIQTYVIRPLLENQEFYGNRADNAYWEGACEVLNPTGKVIGRAYLELAGYGGGLGARLN